MRKIICVLLALLMLAGSAAAEEPRGSIYDALVGNSPSNHLLDHLTEDAEGETSSDTDSESEAEETEEETAGDSGEASEIPPAATGKTVMIYLCGSTLEDGESAAGASLDLYEMMKSGFDESHVNVIVMAGGSEDWYIEAIPGETTGLYRILNDGMYELYNDGEAHNMGDPATLSAFLNASVEMFPAEEYALILWDHGGGSIGGICSDVNFNGDGLSMTELVAALEATPFVQNKLSWIGFDACLMASAEVAMLMSPFAHYMIASEETEPGYGWDYSFLKGMENDATALDTGKRIVDSYFAFLDEIGYDHDDLTLSCTNLSMIADVVEETSSFFESVTVDKNTFASLSRARRNAIGFGRNEKHPDNDYDLVDLGSVVEKLTTEQTAELGQRVSNALEQCVEYTCSDAGCSGLSVYYPFYNKKLYSRNMRAYEDLAISSEYGAFIEIFGNYLISNGSQTWNSLFAEVQEAQKDNRTVLTLQLSEAQLAEIGAANVVAICEGSVQDTWYLAATQQAVLREEDAALAGEYVHTNLFVTDENGKPLGSVPLFYTLCDDGLYMVEAALVDEAGNETNAQLILSRDSATDFVTVEEIYLYDTAIDGYSPRLSGSLENYTAVIHRLDERVMTYDANGALLAFEDWQIAQTQEYRWPLAEGFHLAFVRDQLDVSKLRIGFKITDIFNNVYMSEPLQLNVRPEDAQGYLTTYDDTLLLLEDISISAASNGSSLRLSARVTNRTEAEALIVAQNVMVNGKPTDAGAEVYGNGENEGLLPQEAQMLMLRLPADEALEELTFELALIDAEGNQTGVVPVVISVHMPS